MPKAKSSPKSQTLKGAERGRGDELHQVSETDRLTTNQGTVVSDDQNSLHSGERGPLLLEDFVLREKITHFDHERIPERIVHARGTGAHGYFELEASLSRYSKAAFLQKAGARVPVFVRFSTVAGGAGSVDLPRDVRGFAVKFYTERGQLRPRRQQHSRFLHPRRDEVSGSDPLGEDGTRPWLSSGRVRARHVLGLSYR